ncbi:MAG: hypothetical protein QW638_07285 [Candidatus Bathyarchaeia archaeon]
MQCPGSSWWNGIGIVQARTVEPELRVPSLGIVESVKYLPLQGISVPTDVMMFLKANPDMFVIFEIYEEVLKRLKNTQIQARGEFNLFRDMEAPEIEQLIIEIHVKDKDYEEILKLWDEVAQVLDELPQEQRSKIEIVLEGDK